MPGKWHRYTGAQIAEMRSLRAGGVSLSEIGRRFGVSCNTIGYTLKVWGSRRDKHGHWRGGRWKSRGYWMVMPPDYHYITGSSRYGNAYVLEHRLIIETHLLKTQPDHPALKNGRLQKSWFVHHKNGIKDDNRLENLEVMHRSKHHSWIHYKEEWERLKARVAELEARLAACKCCQLSQ